MYGRMVQNMESVIWWFMLVTFILVQTTATQPKAKRQIYREQVLPLSGGKIPEDAFRADRLALNRLNKEGISVPDGVLLEHRNVHSHPHINKIDPEDEDSVIRVYQQSEHRYAPIEGSYINDRRPSVASTYLIRRPIGRDESNIRTPSQQKPHFQAIFNPGYHLKHQKIHASEYLQTHQNKPTRYPIVYQNHAPKPQPYHAITVPFILPNKEIQEERAFAQSQAQAQAQAQAHVQAQAHLQQHIKKFDLNYPSSEAISGRIRWPLLSDNYERLPSEYDNVLPPSSEHYDFGSALQYYESAESSYPSVNPFEEFPDFLGFRFARKSAEGHATGAVDKNNQPQSKDGGQIHRRVLTVKCEGDAKC